MSDTQERICHNSRLLRMTEDWGQRWSGRWLAQPDREWVRAVAIAHCVLHTVYCTLCIAHCVLHTVYCSLYIAQETVVVVDDGHGKRQTRWQCFNRTMLILLRSIQRLQEDQHSLIETLSSFPLTIQSPTTTTTSYTTATCLPQPVCCLVCTRM